MKRLLLSCALAFAACSPSPAPTPAPAPVPGVASLDDLAKSRDWMHEKAPDLQSHFDKSVKALLMGKPRPDAIDAITKAGYECTYGEAHEKYPDPMAVCTRSFGTPECQVSWEIASTADKGKVDSADGAFTRDCIGTADDFPEPKKSALDDNLIPPPALPATQAQPPKPN